MKQSQVLKKCWKRLKRVARVGVDGEFRLWWNSTRTTACPIPHKMFFRPRSQLACIADKLNTGIVHLQISNKKLDRSIPRILPGFSIIGSNWLLHTAILSCLVTGWVDVVEPWLHSPWIPDTQKRLKRWKAVRTIWQSSRATWICETFLGTTMSLLISLLVLENLLFQCLLIAKDIVQSKPKPAYMTSA